MARDKPLAPDDPRHGTIAGYTNHGCRQECCRAAAREHWKTTPEQKAKRAQRKREKYKSKPRPERYLDAMNFVGRWEVHSDHAFRVDEWADPTFDAVAYNMGLQID